MKRIKRFALTALVCIVVFITMGYASLYVQRWFPDRYVRSDVASPDGAWNAVLAIEVGESIFDEPYYVVRLYPRQGVFRKWRNKKIFEQDANGPDAGRQGDPLLRWKDATHLLVSYIHPELNTPLRASEYKGVHIEYTIR